LVDLLSKIANGEDFKEVYNRFREQNPDFKGNLPPKVPARASTRNNRREEQHANDSREELPHIDGGRNRRNARAENRNV